MRRDDWVREHDTDVPGEIFDDRCHEPVCVRITTEPD